MKNQKLKEIKKYSKFYELKEIFTNDEIVQIRNPDTVEVAISHRTPRAEKKKSSRSTLEHK